MERHSAVAIERVSPETLSSTLPDKAVAIATPARADRALNEVNLIRAERHGVAHRGPALIFMPR